MSYFRTQVKPCLTATSFLKGLACFSLKPKPFPWPVPWGQTSNTFPFPPNLKANEFFRGNPFKPGTGLPGAFLFPLPSDLTEIPLIHPASPHSREFEKTAFGV